ncbi:hypothetical protein PoB_005441200 [Plakobranchus ocellatus]|uniref:Uncharacterized protein n=1 Tax=Plakobranchus ocellatus TaxID=259542 RepID=A0AAV4C973_9GAST|nr:hypothetical protein PoB_005441200 [Plakobranchus ocellatus]
MMIMVDEEDDHGDDDDIYDNDGGGGGGSGGDDDNDDDDDDDYNMMVMMLTTMIMMIMTMAMVVVRSIWLGLLPLTWSIRYLWREIFLLVDSFPGPALEAGKEEKREGGSVNKCRGSTNGCSSFSCN